ncbi:DNA polymerase delta subunit 4 [Trachinotus anak]|uniref:DNA polymerase delta subunit 4 n=1 Tax=Trachinotus anak TaxID=443729 RepID=UPI0039F263BA
MRKVNGRRQHRGEPVLTAPEEEERDVVVVLLGAPHNRKNSFPVSFYATRLVNMTTKHRLITDSFKVVKKARRGGREKRPTPPPPQKEAETEPVREEELHKLRQFDLDWRFGPCTGISRLQRWERAKLHGLNPPEEIRDLLLQTDTDPDYKLSLWSEYPL